jgi:succinyl-CoA synthetase beta subunit
MVLMASSQGGVDVEARAVKSTRAAKSARVLCQIPVDPLVGLRTHQIWELATAIDLDAAFVSDFIGVVRGLYDCAIACEALLAEINPLVVTAQGQLIAVDAKVELDDNALFRHSDLAQRDDWKKDPAQAQAEKLGVSYIRLDGEIGCMVNGAGLAMATMDLIHLYGRAPANFLDIGGGAGGAKVEGALRLILADERVRSVLINIFGGITRCDEVARGIVAALDLLQPAVPVVARLVGTNAEAGQRILAQADVTPAHSLSDAVRQVTELAGEDAV